MIIKAGVLSVFMCCICTISRAQIAVDWLIEPRPNDSLKIAELTRHDNFYPSIQLKVAENGFNLGKKTQIIPVLDLAFQYNNTLNYRFGGGGFVEGQPHKSWYYRIGGITYLEQANNLFKVPYQEYNDQPNSILGVSPMGRIAFQPHKYFNFQLGLDKNFIGEGCRSLFLSDYGKPYAFGRMQTNFWHLEYTILYQGLTEQYQNKTRLKFASNHFLSWNATKWLNINLFESVIFQAKDTLLQRGFDPEYLNPFVFYRPQEYAVGSSDNVLLGGGFTLKYKKHRMYTQFIVDDFLLSEIRKKSGWWANKIGGQIGIKGWLGNGASRFFYRVECNAVRPYTYSHLSPLLNYGNSNSTLSHPLGANFAEILGEFKWQKNKCLGKLVASYGLLGGDKDNYSYGSHIYEAYTLRPYDFGSFIGQGSKQHFFRLNIQFNYQIMEKGAINCFVEFALRYDLKSQVNSSLYAIQYLPLIGIRSQLWNDYRNY